MLKNTLHYLTVVSLLASAVFAQTTDAYKGKPYKGSAQVIPGRIEAELYDLGGQGVAYNDVDAVNNGSGKLNTGNTEQDKFRQEEGVDISYTKPHDKTVGGTPEKTGDLYLGWTAAGEWVKYTVDVQTPGTYQIKAHISSKTDAAEISVALHGPEGGTSSTGTVVLPTTNDWHTWRIVDNLGVVRLPKGPHVLTLSALKGGEFNLDYLEFVPVAEGASSFQPIDVFEQTKRMQRGVNIVGYDPIWKDPAKARFKEHLFKKIREGGFQTIRVNLQAFQHMDTFNRLSPTWIKTMDWIIDNAIKNDLVVILDEHDYEPCGKDEAFCRAKLLSFWEQVAARYKDTPNNVVFEILNEPNLALDDAKWNVLLKDALAVIRRTNPQRTVIIGPAQWNGFKNLAPLQLPADDRNLIATVHYYLPMEFTHQGAYWSKATANLSGIKWGTDAEKQAVVNDFALVQEWAKANNRPILLGEFGAYDKGDMESRAKYTSHLVRTAESFGWAWTYWQFDADFIVYDIDKDTWVEPIRKALIP